MSGKTPLIEMRGINKWFESVHALVDVNFKIYEGEIVGLIGDNGAGKSTLIKILSGVFKPVSGEIYYKGKKIKIASVEDSRRLGIETVFQEEGLIDCFTANENIFINREPLKTHLKFFKRIDYKKMLKEAQLDLDTLGLRGIAGREACFCSGGEKQGIIMARNMHFESRLVILDEPTRALSVAGVRAVHKYIKQLKKKGTACIYISHDLHYVYPLADRIVMIDRGQNVFDIEKKNITLKQIENIILRFSSGKGGAVQISASA